jgi:hypothetical protein
LAREIKELAQLDPGSLTDDELDDAIVELARLRSSLEAVEARVAGEWDGRRVWAASGARSGAAAMSRMTREPKPACGSRLALGRVLRCRTLPIAAEAWLAGEIGAAHVRLLAGARNERTVAALAEAEAMLVHDAQQLHFSAFAQVVAYWKLHADPDGADASDVDRRDRRRVALDQTFGGMWSLSGCLDPISGEAVSNELRRLEQELFDADWAAAKARLGREPKAGELGRTGDQRRADALVEMARRSRTAPADGKAPKPLFTLVLGSDAFRHLSELASGQVVSAAAVAPWVDDAELERILFAEGTSRVIDVSRKRSFQGALRRLIEVRDRECFHRTCDVRADRCQVDHVEPWASGGMTCQENGRLACGSHNRARHQRPPPASPA